MFKPPNNSRSYFRRETIVTEALTFLGGLYSNKLLHYVMLFFISYSSLHNRRTVIHRNLFYALLMEVTVRMILYTQQSNSFVSDEEDEPRKGIEYFVSNPENIVDLCFFFFCGSKP